VKDHSLPTWIELAPGSFDAAVPRPYSGIDFWSTITVAMCGVETRVD